MSDFPALTKKLVDFAGSRALLLIVLMVLAAISEGLGLLLIVPLLAFAGTLGSSAAPGRILNDLNALATEVGLVPKFEVVLAGFLVLVILRQLVVFWSARLAANIRIEFVAEIRKEYFAALGETSWRFLKGAKLDQIGQVLFTDCWRIGEAGLHLVRILTGVILMAANIYVAVLVSPVLALSAIGGIALLTLLFSNRMNTARQRGWEISELHEHIYRIIENYLENIRVAKMAGSTQRMQAGLNAHLDALSSRLSGCISDSESVILRLQIVSAAVIALALLFAVNVLGAGGPELLLLIFIVARFVPRVSSVNQDLHRLVHDLPAFAHAQRILDECRDHPDRAANAVAIPRIRESIGVRNVTVVADGNPDNLILDNFTLSVAKHETCAIIGPSGVGKSTLADVMAGLLTPDFGEIVLDDKSLNSESLGSWRRHVGYVSQTTTLLQDSIVSNLNWVLKRPATDKDIMYALRCAEIDEVIADLPDGLQTVVDRRQGRLSGGERQRLAIARELLRCPDLLILDEATNALDEETEANVLNNLRQYYPDLTILMIAHRASAIAIADRVVDLGQRNNAESN